MSALAVVAGVAAMAPHAGELTSATEATFDDKIELRPLALRSEMYDRNGKQITVLRGEENRERVALADIPHTVQTAIVQLEDASFYDHGGVNLRAVTRAAVKNVGTGGISQGGSTITQQLIKNAVLSSEKELDRKLKEMRLAGQLESQMSKDEILEHYLNLVYFGNGAYGVKAAAEVYFAKDVADIDWAEAALLAGLISSPSANDPIAHPERARARRKLALNRLVANGDITRKDEARYNRRALPTSAQQVVPTIRDYFIEDVTQKLLDEPILSADKRERINMVFGGGLRIYTTFDPRAQRLADAARDEVLPKNDGGFTIAASSIEPATGAVRAVIGGPGFDEYKYNIATQGLGRQPGSSFKTMVLTAAVEQGIAEKDLLDGIGPCEFDNTGGTPNPYELENFEESRGRLTTLEKQTLASSNCGFIRLGQYVGLDAVVDVAKRLGITSELSDEIISLPLGTMEVRPIEMASAYATIANEGVRHDPYLIERIETVDGEVLFEHQPRPVRAISRETARRVQAILKANVEDGTGVAARVEGHDAGGKTGTTQNFEDAWFVGFTRHLSTAVWMGNPAAKIQMRDVGGREVTGGSFPAQMWGRYMRRYHAEAALVPLPFSEPVEVRRSARELLLEGETSRLVQPEDVAPVPGTRAQARRPGAGRGPNVNRPNVNRPNVNRPNVNSSTGAGQVNPSPAPVTPLPPPPPQAPAPQSPAADPAAAGTVVVVDEAPEPTQIGARPR